MSRPIAVKAHRLNPRPAAKEAMAANAAPPAPTGATTLPIQLIRFSHVPCRGPAKAMGAVQGGVSTLHPRGNAQAKTEAVGGWQEGDRRRHEEALGVT
jgi:hypothetical protein